LASGAMQIVDVLRYQKKRPFETGFQVRQGPVSGIREDAGMKQLPAPVAVETVHPGGTPRVASWACNVFDAVVFPKAFRPAEGPNAGFRRNPGSGQYDDGAIRRHAK